MAEVDEHSALAHMPGCGPRRPVHVNFNSWMRSTFEELVEEAAAAPVEGWDFSWLEGRATEERPTWGYQRLLGLMLAQSTAALDIQTGGGEVLAGAGAENFPQTIVATEGWPPNVDRATERSTLVAGRTGSSASSSSAR